MPFISQSNFLQALGWAVVNSLWQMALLWMLFKIIVWIVKPGSALKSRLAFYVLLAGSGWFLFTLVRAFFSPVTETLLTWNQISYSVNDQLTAILPYASVLYLLLLAFPLIRFITALQQVQQLRTKKIQKIEVQWRLFVKKMTAYLEIRKPVQVWISENISTPVTVGFLKPVILVPLAAVNKLSPEQMESVLLHELAHIKRYDYLVNIITVIIKTIFYFNPFTRNLANVIEEEREKSCDEWVLQYQYDAYAYSSALLALEQMKRHSLQLALAAASNKELLLERVKKIMGIPTQPVYSVRNNLKWITGIIGSALLFFALFTNSLKIKVNNGNTDFEGAFYAYLNTGSNPDLSLNYLSDPKETPGKPKHKPGTELKKDAVSPEGYNYGFITSGDNPFYKLANYIPPQELTVLDEADELQIKEALDASKKIIKDVQLNEVKTAAADVLTEKEKEAVQRYYEKELEKADWSKMEEKLRASYNQINWTEVNARLQQEIQRIRIDSMANVYKTALNSIDKAKLELQANNLKGIPDSRFTISVLDSVKKVMKLSLQQLNEKKEKKVIKL